VRRERCNTGVDIGEDRQGTDGDVDLIGVRAFPDADVRKPTGDPPDADDRSRPFEFGAAFAFALDKGFPLVWWHVCWQTDLDFDEKLDLDSPFGLCLSFGG